MASKRGNNAVSDDFTKKRLWLSKNVVELGEIFCDCLSFPLMISLMLDTFTQLTENKGNQMKILHSLPSSFYISQ